MDEKENVILRRLPSYDPDRIEGIIREGLEDLGLTSKVQGRITIKPNVVMAHHKVAPSAYTRPEFLDGVLGAITTSNGIAKRITVAEKTGAGLPTTRMMRRAGYYRLKRKHKIKLLPIEESKKTTVPLEKGKVHDKITTAREIATNDFCVYTPKLKSNALSFGLTAALKLNIGILCDRERMRDHNYKLDEKIVDLYEVGRPDFIATDGIEMSLGGNHLTQHGYPLGLIVMAKNAVAHDAVCARILHLDPEKLPHLRIARERGYGPLDLESIHITGDISLEEVQNKTKDWDRGLMDIRDLDCGMEILCGEPFCQGGCHGVVLDWLHMIKDRKPQLWENLPPWTLVMGKYKGDVSADRLMVIGSCSEIQGNVKARIKRRIRGCPPKHKDLVLGFFLKAGIVNPMFRFDLILDAYPYLFFSWCRRILKGWF
ncbi:MAG: DUF362 domain-containing protein [Candidatus Aminicenantes bacterium]|jgi:uncharacterized protein (DUF362 family)